MLFSWNFHYAILYLLHIVMLLFKVNIFVYTDLTLIQELSISLFLIVICLFMFLNAF